MTRAFGIILILLVGGCVRLGLPARPTDSEPIQLPPETDASLGVLHRIADESWTEEPFANGPLALLATEGGEMRSWTLAPCASGAPVCAGAPNGPAGTLTRTREYLVVDGLYDRRFWLSWGGDGYVERHGTYRPLAWDARPNGTGEGYDPVVETPFRHD